MQRTYRSDVRIGERYRDTQTGMEGVVTVLSFFQHGCERACLESLVDGDVKEVYFDAARLEHIATRQRATVKVPGGPNQGPSPKRSAPKR